MISPQRTNQDIREREAEVIEDPKIKLIKGDEHCITAKQIKYTTCKKTTTDETQHPPWPDL